MYNMLCKIQLSGNSDENFKTDIPTTLLHRGTSSIIYRLINARFADRDWDHMEIDGVDYDDENKMYTVLVECI